MGTEDRKGALGFCACFDWEPCPCGVASKSEPPHCMYCCLDLTKDQRKQFDFTTWEHIPPRPKGLPIQISCGACQTTIDNPTQEQIDYHFTEEKHDVRKN